MIGYPATTGRAAVRAQRHGVSVILPFARADARLEAAAASVWSQTGVAAEVVFVDTGAGPAERLRAERLAADGPSAMVRAPARRGAALAAGFAAAAHPVLSTLDADTVLTPGTLKAAHAALTADPRAVVVAPEERAFAVGTVAFPFVPLGTLKGGALTAHIAADPSAVPAQITLTRALYGRTLGADARLGPFAIWSLALELTGFASAFVRLDGTGHITRPRPTGVTPGAAALDLARAVLAHGDMLATRFGADAFGMLGAALAAVGAGEAVRDGIAALTRRAAFEGAVLSDLRALRRAVDATTDHAAGNAADPGARLAAAFAAVADRVDA
ncbi:glycosyltransferase family protein [Stappia sp. 22II-S9-Z10]|nr:glycosyltransferase family protein [Stappia sp. 22II-S9-Z10]